MDFSRVAPLVAALMLAWLCLPACDVGPLATAGPKPEEVGLQPADVPADVQRCQNSGPVDRYLADVKVRDQAAYQSVTSAWTQLKSGGARGAAVAVFAGNAPACSLPWGVAPGRSLASIVVQFRDDQAAAAAFRRGILGFPTPSAEQQTPGMSQGVATGLSENSWAVQRDEDGRSLYVAWWQDKAFAVFLVSVDLDTSESQRAADAVERRIG
jgi:hypothetical protein